MKLNVNVKLHVKVNVNMKWSTNVNVNMNGHSRLPYESDLAWVRGYIELEAI